MKNYIFGISTFMLILGLNGCSDNTDLVKDGVMNFNKTITVGEAFDNWNDCESSEWKSFKTDNNTPVVEFTCEVKDIKEFLNKAKSFLPKKEQSNASYLDIESVTKIFQWTINKDDTFQINNVQSKMVWVDGTKSLTSLKPMKEFRIVYNNKKNPFSLGNINKQVAIPIAYSIKILKIQAK